MDLKNNTLAVGLITLFVGVLIGTVVNRGIFWRPYHSPGHTQIFTQKCDEEGCLSIMHNAMDSMTSSLEGKTGEDLDRAFLSEMIVHHEGAIDMAKILLMNTKRPELIKLGNEIISAQTKEIEMMKTWRDSWFR